jgi:hypothetical protein
MKLKYFFLGFICTGISSVAGAQIVSCSYVNGGYSPELSVEIALPYNTMRISGYSEFSADGPSDKKFKTSRAYHRESNGNCKVTVTDAGGSPAKVILNIPKNLKNEDTFSATVENAADGKVIPENAKAQICKYRGIDDGKAGRECPEGGAAEDKNKGLHPVKLNIVQCDSDLSKNCFDKPDPNYCFVPVECWIKKNGADIQSGEAVFCRKSVFNKTYKDQFSRIKACGDDPDASLQQKLEEFMGSSELRELQKPQGAK